MRKLIPAAAPILLAALTLALPARAGVGVWTPLGPEGGSVWALAVDPDDADVVYAGTRNGVFKSSDAGATWASASKGLGPAGVWVRTLAVTSEAVYAGTDFNGVYKSTDGGATWVSASKGLPAPESYTPNVSVLVADPRFPNRIWAAAGRSVFLTMNGGLTWQERSRGLPVDAIGRGLALAPDGRTLYVSNYRAVFKTTNLGKRWTRVSFGLPGDRSLGEVAVDPTVPSTVFAGAGTGLWRTTNGGATWKRTLDGGAVLALTWQGTRLFASVFSDSKHGIYSSDDHGATWTAAAESPSDPTILDLAGGPDLVYAGTGSDFEPGGVFRSLDRGRTWDLSITGLTSLGARAVTVDPSNPDVLYTGIDDLGVFKSADRGATWERLDLGPFDAGRPIRIGTILVDPSDPSIIYAGCSFGAGVPGIFRSRDAGASWERVSVGPFTEVLAADPRTPGAVWVAGVPALYHSDDQGESLEGLPVPDESNVQVKAFQVDPHDPGVLWAGGGFGPAPAPFRLFRSADAGQTWQRRESGLSGTVLALAVDPANSNVVLAGTETGLYRTTNAGLAWTQVPGFSAAVNTVVAAPTTPTAFYAHLAGFGVQRSTDGGVTWTPARRGLAPVPVSTLTVAPGNPRQLYAGSQTRGVFTYIEP